MASEERERAFSLTKGPFLEMLEYLDPFSAIFSDLYFYAAYSAHSVYIRHCRKNALTPRGTLACIVFRPGHAFLKDAQFPISDCRRIVGLSSRRYTQVGIFDETSLKRFFFSRHRL